MSTTCEYYNVQQFKRLYEGFSNSSFSTYHLNARSLPKNDDDFTNYLSSLNHEFSIIALSETWLTDSTEMLYDCCRPQRTGGGVSIYIHTSLQFCVREDLVHELKNVDVEALFIEITFCSFFSGRNVIIGCVYRPPDTDLGSFNDMLGSTLERMNMERKLCFLLEDFNLDL